MVEKDKEKDKEIKEDKSADANAKAEADANTEETKDAEGVQDSEKEEEKEVEKTTEELLKDMTDKYMRALAEIDNTRKRATKEKDDFVKFAKSESIREFLPVLDNLDRAIHATKKTEDAKHLKKGVEMVIGQLDGVFKKMGVKEVTTKGVFDPELHHVMHKEHAKGKKDGEIIEVYQKGYLLNGSLVRPAMVKVASKEENKKDKE